MCVKWSISISGGWSFYILVLAVAVQSDIVIHLIGMGQAVTSLGLCCQSMQVSFSSTVDSCHFLQVFLMSLTSHLAHQLLLVVLYSPSAHHAASDRMPPVMFLFIVNFTQTSNSMDES